ncbi:hypothetical protein K503DRAFT_805101 [Rhizopogon vinicolor AM-OR11-026]|uniref:Uncharacterized protein n=1 Tax=Rhizopogon vinicolor AM-OR11-026 TaxID=1314800 RepID=A0A1B7MJ24_9AGAM|nr:hypothetical protein K503DRAFT_805101 [Rhizopogon vinicolor AM-OR11-026]
MPIVSSTGILLLPPHDSERREDPTVVTVRPNGQLSITSLDHPSVPGENSFDPEGDRTQFSSVLISATGVQTISATGNGIISSSLRSAISVTTTFSNSFSSLTVTIILSNSTSTNSSLSAPTALASPVIVNTTKAQFSTSGNGSPFTPTALASSVFQQLIICTDNTRLSHEHHQGSLIRRVLRRDHPRRGLHHHLRPGILSTAGSLACRSAECGG